MNNKKSFKLSNLFFDRVMALLAMANLCLVIVDLSYIPWRDFYIRNLPQITKIYDRIKGIEKHRETQNYLDKVKALQVQVSETGLNSNQARTKLAELRMLSSEMVDSNPFAAVNKSGNFEKAKNRIRDRLNRQSAKESFNQFWSQQYLSTRGWQTEIDFFNGEIRPLIATNYFRRIGENGEFLDILWLIDLPFIVIFVVDFLGRCLYLRRLHPSLSWVNTILWRWYDLFLLLPFWRWLRVISVTVRLHEARLLNLQPLQQQVNQSILSNFAEDLTEIVVIRVINQIQGSINRGDITRWLGEKPGLRPYIDINNIDEVEAITGILMRTIVYQVIPKIKPEIIALVQHSITSILSQLPMSRQLTNLPGSHDMQTRLSQQLASEITNSIYGALTAALADSVGGELSSQLGQRFTRVLGEELRKKHLLNEFQILLVDLLEEIKLNYVQQLSQEDIEQIIEQSRQLRTQAKSRPRTNDY